MKSKIKWYKKLTTRQKAVFWTLTFVLLTVAYSLITNIFYVPMVYGGLPPMDSITIQNNHQTVPIGENFTVSIRVRSEEEFNKIIAVMDISSAPVTLNIGETVFPPSGCWQSTPSIINNNLPPNAIIGTTMSDNSHAVNCDAATDSNSISEYVRITFTVSESASIGSYTIPFRTGNGNTEFRKLDGSDWDPTTYEEIQFTVESAPPEPTPTADPTNPCTGQFAIANHDDSATEPPVGLIQSDGQSNARIAFWYKMPEASCLTGNKVSMVHAEFRLLDQNGQYYQLGGSENTGEIWDRNDETWHFGPSFCITVANCEFLIDEVSDNARFRIFTNDGNTELEEFILPGEWKELGHIWLHMGPNIPTGEIPVEITLMQSEFWFENPFPTHVTVNNLIHGEPPPPPPPNQEGCLQTNFNVCLPLISKPE